MFYGIVSLDNSEWMRNGDYVPSRLEAQQDAGRFNIFALMNMNKLKTNLLLLI